MASAGQPLVPVLEYRRLTLNKEDGNVVTDYLISNILDT